jgi:peptide methionine sulfoxide reductase msrA/msrB
VQDKNAMRPFKLLWTLLAIVPVIAIVPLTMRATETHTGKTMTYNKLTPEEERVIIDKGTEMPFTGKYDNFWEAGTYYCKRCGAPLFRSKDKFDAGCGWPSFDDAIPGAVKRTLDADGVREEITCARCGAHLGHVFVGEQLTAKDTRYCVNSISMTFVPADSDVTYQKAYFAGGCFWGTQYMLEKANGVVSTRVGYMGGHIKNPTYQEVCSDTTGYAETVEVVYDPRKTSYEKLAKLFFEIHDPTEVDRQGPDIGNQYRSEIFYVDDAQKQVAESLVSILKGRGYDVVTQLAEADTFWPAEAYHQHYYDHTGGQPYCHAYTKRF